MPGVSVLPNSPGLGSFGSSHSKTQNGFARPTDDSVAEIKTKAREAVLKEARGASALTLIKTARSQFTAGKDYETQGDLKGALSSFTKAASLAKMTMDSTEFISETRNGKGGVLRKEFMDFFDHDGTDLTARTTAVEEKLRAFEKAQTTNNGSASPDGPISKPGGSIADRMKALQDNGLSIGSSKRFSREVQNVSTPPTPLSPNRFSPQSTSPPSNLLTNLAPSTPVSSNHSPHSFVSPSTLGPPSPSSSPPSSPQTNNYDLSGFTQAFPSIDELDENPAFTLPSVPTGLSTGSNKSSPKDLTSLPSLRNFTVPFERPSSTPITPTINTFHSRPGSPSKPAIPLKPSNLSINSSNPSPSPPGHAKTPLPVTNTASPKELLSYIRDYNVLLLDVRNRADFDREHIKAGAVVCVEPSVLLRDSVTAEMLEDAMVVAPKHEVGLFINRDKFDLVAVYDDKSTTFGSSNSPLSILIRAISEQAFRKMLKRMPMILAGGIEAWKKEIGNTQVVRGEASTFIDAPKPITPSASINGLTASTSSPNGSNNPFANGTLGTSTFTPTASSLVNGPSNPGVDQRQLWSPSRSRADTNPVGYEPPPSFNQHRPTYSLDQAPNHSRSPAEVHYTGGGSIDPSRSLVRRPAISRAPVSTSSNFGHSIPENGTSSPMSPTMTNGTSSITYPQFPRRISPTISGSSGPSSFAQYDINPPPQASINPSLSRRRSDYVDQSQEALSGLQHPSRPSIDYPELSSQHILRPPPAVASSALERQDNRPRVPQQPFQSNGGLSAPKHVRIPSDYPVTYWSDSQIGYSGLKNLGNTCYMNAPIQCLSATVPFAMFFTDGRWKSAINFTNMMGTKGRLTGAFATLVHEMWGGDLPYLTPNDFRKTICQLKSQYIGTDQHDSQEFLSFLLDGVHEDLNRIITRPVWAPTPEQEAELERLPPQIASDQEWKAWKLRNDSIIVDYFQGQFRSRLECLTCHKTSTTYNVFSILQLPIPHGRSGKVPLQRCLDTFFTTETLEKDDAWDCPRCKVKRKASKQLTLARLPPILLIHLKRFEANGRFSDKIDTFVDFPMKSLDLTNYMPPPLPPGVDKGQPNGAISHSPQDPRTQLPPYKYDLYGVTNHIGNLSSGHYTAFVASRPGWLYCDDSTVKPVDSKQVVSQRAYVLFYKRTKA